MVRTAGRALRRWWNEHPHCADAFLGIALTLFGIGASWPNLVGPTNIVPDHGWWVLALGAVATVGTCAVRRSHPYLAWAGLTFLVLALDAVNLLIDRQGVGPTYLTDVFSTNAGFGVPILVGSVAAYASTPMAWVCAVVSAVAVQLGDQVASTTPFILTQALYFGTVYLLVDSIGVLVGMNVRTQRERLSAVEERSARLALAREQTALLAASTERSRIAREMHDVVAHSLAVMITMADGAAASVDRNPQMAKEALGILSETGRSALADTRRLVGVLRDDPGASSDPAVRTPQAGAASAVPGDVAGAPGGEVTPAPAPPAQLVAAPEPPAAPQAAPHVSRRRSLFSHGGTTPDQPTTGSVPVVREMPVPEFAPPGTVAPHEPTEDIVALRRRATDARADRSTGDIPMAPAPEQSDLRVLVDRFRAAGVPVEYEWSGRELPEDKGLQLTLFRIAQESMTNILRYAPTTRSVRLAVGRHTGTAVLTVDNDAAPGSTPVHGSGKGLIGMRERAAVYGGTVDAGPTETGWRVRAVLRWDEDDEGTTPWQMPM